MKRIAAGAANNRVALGYSAALLALIALGACSGRSTGGGGTMGSGAGQPDWPAGMGEGDWPEVAPLPTPEIPPFPDLCSPLKIELAPPGKTDPHVSCPCAIENQFCAFDACVRSADCDAVCSAFSDPSQPQVSDCIGNCDSDADCNFGSFCTKKIPGAITGECSFGASLQLCLDDDDCSVEAHCVAVRADGVRRCSTQSECNTTADCADGNRCALPDQSFVGWCGSGTDGSACYRNTDCRPGRHCAHSADVPDPLGQGTCTSGLEDTPCGSDDDCTDGGKCFFSKCSGGAVNDGCAADTDCEPGLQCVNLGITFEPTFAICTDGSVGSSCEQASQCAAGNYCSHGICFDGSATSYCDQDSQCQSGRCLVGAWDYEMCTTGEPGAACMGADDCLSTACSRGPELRVGDPGVCE